MQSSVSAVWNVNDVLCMCVTWNVSNDLCVQF